MLQLISQNTVDHRIIDLLRSLADRCYVGSDNIDICHVEVECDEIQLPEAAATGHLRTGSVHRAATVRPGDT